jgi:hypothetical protein
MPDFPGALKRAPSDGNFFHTVTEMPLRLYCDIGTLAVHSLPLPSFNISLFQTWAHRQQAAGLFSAPRTPDWSDLG